MGVFLYFKPVIFTIMAFGLSVSTAFADENDIYREMYDILNRIERSTSLSESDYLDRLLKHKILSAKEDNFKSKEKIKHLENSAQYDSGVDFIYGQSFLKKGLPKILSEYGPQRVSYIFIDLDHLKNLNSTYGHNNTDEVLLRFAQRVNKVLLTSTRDHEGYFGRNGGDEFYMILLNSPESRVVQVAKKIKSALSSYDSIFKGLDKEPSNKIEEGQRYDKATVSVTMGIDSKRIDPTDMSTNDMERTLKDLSFRSDQAMYEGKMQARGSIRVAKYCSKIFN